jgi:endonuclease G, mitochondrial
MRNHEAGKVHLYIFNLMKINWLILILCFISGSGWSQNIYKNKSNNSYELFKSLEKIKLNRIRQQLDSLAIHTIPADGQLVKHSAWVAGYSSKHKQPYWVSHFITKDILYGNYTRSDDFRVDSLVKKGTADSADYMNSGYDRGHMAPSADFRWSKRALSESNLYSNIAPQNPQLNRGTWAKLESLIREWAIENNEIYVVTGPVLNQQFTNLQQGSYQVSIPHYFYKIIVDLYPPIYKAIAFLLPNKNVPCKLNSYAATIDSLEKLTGIDFFQTLGDSLENILEKQADIYSWEKDYQEEIDSAALKNFGKGKLNTTQAKDHIGKYTTICGKVVSIKFVENGKGNPTYINLDKKFPDQQFTVVIYGEARSTFSYIPDEKLMDKTICVKGKIGQYKEIPQIVVNEEEQIEIME